MKNVVYSCKKLRPYNVKKQMLEINQKMMVNFFKL
jgi:hypothetical protein